MNRAARLRKASLAKRLDEARLLLEREGWTVAPPPERVIAEPTLGHDQCEYPDRYGEPGDCCVQEADRRRDTPDGWLWLCEDHFDAPLEELFDERIAA